MTNTQATIAFVFLMISVIANGFATMRGIRDRVSLQLRIIAIVAAGAAWPVMLF